MKVRLKAYAGAVTPHLEPDEATVVEMPDGSDINDLNRAAEAFARDSIEPVGTWTVVSGPVPPRRKCPDDGTCHHQCERNECFRVRGCGPLTGVYHNDEWPTLVEALNRVRDLEAAAKADSDGE